MRGEQHRDEKNHLSFWIRLCYEESHTLTLEPRLTRPRVLNCLPSEIRARQIWFDSFGVSQNTLLLVLFLFSVCFLTLKDTKQLTHEN